MKAFLLIWALMSFGPQGEVVQSVHLTRAECQASLGKIATSIINPQFATGPQKILGQANGLVQISPQPIGITAATGPTIRDSKTAEVSNGPTIRSGITAPPDPKFRPGIKGESKDDNHDVKCVQFRAER